MDDWIFEILRSDGSITVNKQLIRAIGLKEAVLYCELISKYFYFKEKGMLDEDGGFYNTVEDLEYSTGLSKKEQLRTIANLKNLGLIDVKVKGLPAKRYFYVNKNIDILKKYILQSQENSQLSPLGTTGCTKKEQLDVPKWHGNNTNINNTKGIILNNIEKDARRKNFDESLASTSQEKFFKILSYYFEKYKEKMGTEHPALKLHQLERIHDELMSFDDEHALELDDWVQIIDTFFERKIQTNYNINHFANENILLNTLRKVI